MTRTITFSVQEIQKILPQFHSHIKQPHKQLMYTLTIFYLLDTEQQIQVLHTVLPLENGKSFVIYVLQHSEYRSNFLTFMSDRTLQHIFQKEIHYA